jgi:hypothetical protein
LVFQVCPLAGGEELPVIVIETLCDMERASTSKIRINESRISRAGWLVFDCHSLCLVEDWDLKTVFPVQHFDKNDCFVVFGILRAVEESDGCLSDGLM